jgi:hypothetical protein
MSPRSKVNFFEADAMTLGVQTGLSKANSLSTKYEMYFNMKQPIKRSCRYSLLGSSS